MNCFFAFFRARYRTVMNFKIAAVSGFITQIFFALFRIYIILAFSADNTYSSPMKIQSTIIYIWLTQMFFSIVPWNVNWDEFGMIKNGDVAYEIVRPIDLFSMFFSKTLAWRLASSIVRALPILLTNIVVLPFIGLYDISIFCMRWRNIGFFLVSIIIAYILSSLITVFLYSITLMIINASNFIGFFNSIAMLISGTIIPLSFFPSWAEKILDLTPFKGVIDTPAMIVTGEYSTHEIIISILGQIAWCICLWLVSRILLHKSMNRLVLQGG